MTTLQIDMRTHRETVRIAGIFLRPKTVKGFLFKCSLVRIFLFVEKELMKKRLFIRKGKRMKLNFCNIAWIESASVPQISRAPFCHTSQICLP